LLYFAFLNQNPLITVNELHVTINNMVNRQIQKLVKRVKEVEQKKTEVDKGVPKIRLSKMIGKMAFLYEKFRNAIDYRDDHLLRKNAIYRILKRRLVHKIKAADVSRLLINELIRARYLEDNKVPETKISQVSDVINKYIILHNLAIKYYEPKEVPELYEFILGLLASEVETVLVSSKIDNAYIEAFYHTVEDRILVKEDKIISKRELDLQTYVAIVKAISKPDDVLLSYKLFKLYYPNWPTASRELINEIARNLKKLKNNIDIQINHPLGNHISKNLKSLAVYYKILRDIFESEDREKSMEDIIQNPDILEDHIKSACNSLYKKVKNKLNKNVFRSIVYIFFTKMILAIIIEFPFDVYIYGHVNYITLAINILFPPLLLFLITMSVRTPGPKNTEKIINGIKKIVYEKDTDPIFEIKRSYGRSKVLNNLFKFIYSVTFILSYGIIIKILYEFDFNILNGFLFLLFLSIVSFFGIRVRTIAHDWRVIPYKENMLTFLLDIFSYPIIRVGKWISNKFSKLNVFVFILDFIIEAPFKSFIEIIEDWFTFVKEKKEEIY